MWGARSSLLVGFAVGLAATGIGIAGRACRPPTSAGSIDDVAVPAHQRVPAAFPGLPLLVILAAFLPPGIGTVILVLTLTGWAGSARVLRSQALSIRGKDFVAAAIVTGERPARIMFREILPEHGIDRHDHAARLA